MKTNWPAFRHGYLILASIAWATSPVHAQTREPAGATATAAVISSVALTQAPQRAAVRVEGEGRLDVHTTRMQSPDRLVLDFAGARLAVQKTVIEGVSAPVRGVRIGQYRPDVVRVVIDLTAVTPYQLSRDAGAVVIYLDTQPAAPEEVPANLTMLTSKQNEKPRPEFHYTSAAPRLVSAPGELTQPSIVLASFNRKNEPIRPDGAAQQSAQQAVQQATTAATTLATTAAQAPTSSTAAAATPAVKYTGEPISVNLKDVDLRDFFRLIHEISGLNVVLDPAVKGTLTIVLDEVPWDQALDIVLQNNGLEKQLHGNVLRIATRETLKKEADSSRELEKAENEAQEMVTVTRVLSYSKADLLKDTLKKFLTARGDILSDSRSNQLIVRDIPAVIPTIDIDRE